MAGRKTVAAGPRVTWPVPIVRDAGSLRTWLKSWISGNEHNVHCTGLRF
jgi:hypothetical protein